MLQVERLQAIQLWEHKLFRLPILYSSYAFKNYQFYANELCLIFDKQRVISHGDVNIFI